MMNKNVEAFKKYYDNATKEQVIEDMFLDICDLQQRIDKAKDLSDEIYNFIKSRNSNLFYEIEDLLIKQDEILGGKE